MQFRLLLINPVLAPENVRHDVNVMIDKKMKSNNTNATKKTIKKENKKMKILPWFIFCRTEKSHKPKYYPVFPVAALKISAPQSLLKP